MDSPWGTKLAFPVMGTSVLNLLLVSQIWDQNGFIVTVGRDGKEHSREGERLNCPHNFETSAHLADVLGTSL